MLKEKIVYRAGGVDCIGHLYHDPANKQQRPAVIVAHAWRGQDDFARQKAAELATLGYVSFAADVYGEGQTGDTDDKAAALMTPLFQNRTLLRERILGAFNILKGHPSVDPERIGAIGFCFGGLTVIELLKSGTPVKGVVSFHGLLGNTFGDIRAQTVPIASRIPGSILILHGNQDPFVSRSDIENFQASMTEASVDWQLVEYGHTVHAFTNPEVHNRDTGMAYDLKSAKRSWLAMRNFFEEIFAK